MSVKDLLQIVLITYNRASELDATLHQLLAPHSPVKDFDITILNNNSTDNTIEIIKKHSSRHHNLRHWCNRYNVGANANIAKAMEMASKRYHWIICDDDVYDWSGWHEVEDAIFHNLPYICVSTYALNSHTAALPEYQLLQLSFVPATIIRTDLYSDTLFRNVYDCVFSMFPQLVPATMLINNGGKIHVIKNAIVDNGTTSSSNSSYIRGAKQSETFIRNRTMTWFSGYVQLIANIHDKKLARKCFLAPIIGDTKVAFGLREFFAGCFFSFRGKECAMHMYDIMSQAGIGIRCALMLISILQNSPLYYFVKKWRDRKCSHRKLQC